MTRAALQHRSALKCLTLVRSLVLFLVPVGAAEYETIIEQCHGQTPALPLRTLDGIHLATARVSGEWEVTTTDGRLREAALVLGFSVYPPTLPTSAAP
jgi:hypothetical protein